MDVASEREELDRRLVAAGIPHAAAIVARARNTIALRTPSQDVGRPGASRAFGRPDLAGAWPVWAERRETLSEALPAAEVDRLVDEGALVARGDLVTAPLAFLAQVRCDELAAVDFDHRLPDRGLLSFFVHPTLVLRPIDPDARILAPARALWFPEPDALTPAEPPDDAPHDLRYDAYALRFRRALVLPPLHLLRDLDLGGADAAYAWLQAEQSASIPADRLLGFPTAAFEPPPPGHELLAQFQSSDFRAPWLALYVPSESLGEGRLDRAVCFAQD